MSITSSIQNRLSHTRKGIALPIQSFYSLGGKAAVQKAMSRLVSRGVVRRVSRGFYVRPVTLKTVPGITVTASAENIARAWAKKHGYRLVLQGFDSAYRIGLQTQAPMKMVFWTNGPAKEFRVGYDAVEVRHVNKQKLKWGESPEGMMYRGLLVTHPGSNAINSLKTALNRLSLGGIEAKTTVRKLTNAPEISRWHGSLHEVYGALK